MRLWWFLEFGCVFIVVLLFGLVKFGKAEVYIVTVEGEPIISYKGGIDGFEATAVESDDSYFPLLLLSSTLPSGYR